MAANSPGQVSGRGDDVAATFRERFEASHSPEDYLNWLNDYVNRQGRSDDELHALCSWAYSVVHDLQNKIAEAHRGS